jgi:hypothetical protein
VQETCLCSVCLGNSLHSPAYSAIGRWRSPEARALFGKSGRVRSGQGELGERKVIESLALPGASNEKQLGENEADLIARPTMAQYRDSSGFFFPLSVSLSTPTVEYSTSKHQSTTRAIVPGNKVSPRTGVLLLNRSIAVLPHWLARSLCSSGSAQVNSNLHYPLFLVLSTGKAGSG